MEQLKGCLVFYVPVKVNSVINYNNIIDLAKESHIDTIASMKEKGWETMFVPCVGEASHVSKVELSGSGCIIVYVNINAEENMQGINVANLIDSAKESHIDLIQTMRDRGWELVLMPCVGEGGRIEKVNFEEEGNDNDII